MSSFDCHRARRSSQKTLGIFRTKPGPLTVEFVKVYRGPLHKNEQLIIISLLVGGGYRQHKFKCLCEEKQVCY